MRGQKEGQENVGLTDQAGALKNVGAILVLKRGWVEPGLANVPWVWRVQTPLVLMREWIGKVVQGKAQLQEERGLEGRWEVPC